MEETNVSVDCVTYRLNKPFMVIAAQNPIELAGTCPLPEAQSDRFLMKIAMGYPQQQEELRNLSDQQQTHPVESISTVTILDQFSIDPGKVQGLFITLVEK